VQGTINQFYVIISVDAVNRNEQVHQSAVCK